MWGFVGLKETLPCIHTKALCLRQGNDTFAEQKKLNMMLVHVPCWSYDTGRKKIEQNARGESEVSDTRADNSGAESLNFTILMSKKGSGLTSATYAYLLFHFTLFKCVTLSCSVLFQINNFTFYLTFGFANSTT